MWLPPKLGIDPVSPALAGGFFTIEPPEKSNIYIFKFKNFSFPPSHEACGTLVPDPGIEPGSPAVEAQCLNP